MTQNFRQIDFTKRFTKQFAKLSDDKKLAFIEKLRLFQTNPSAPELRNHALKGKYVGYRSIDIAWDLRALYYIEQDRLVIFAFIGTHSQLY